MEAERILVEAMACSIRIAMPHDYAAAIEENRPDLIVIDAGVVESGGLDAVDSFQQLGSTLIFTTLTRHSMDWLPTFNGFATVAKPFVDEELLSAVRAALAAAAPEV